MPERLAALGRRRADRSSDPPARHRPLERRVVPGADARPAARRGRRPGRAQGRRAAVRDAGAAVGGRGPPPDRSLGRGRDRRPGTRAVRPGRARARRGWPPWRARPPRAAVIFSTRRACRPPWNTPLTNAATQAIATSRPMIRAPIASAFASLCSRPRRAVTGSAASTQRMPRILLATICSPVPLPPRTMARSASPPATARAAGAITSG